MNARIQSLYKIVASCFTGNAVDMDRLIEAAVNDLGGWKLLELEIQQGLARGPLGERYAAHKLLAGIYTVLTHVPPAGVRSAEGAATMTRLRFILENAFIATLDQSIVANMPVDVPDSSQFGEWLHDLVALHPAGSHVAYTRYLAEEATIEDIRFYLVQESAIDANTDDFLAALQIGAPTSAKLEIAANYWDEMGEGDHNLLHSSLFQEALKSFGIEHTETDDALTLEALICGNLQTMLSLRREFFYLGIGYFAATEQLVPDRFRALEKGWERVGLSRKGADYHLLHIEVDGHHTERWYRDVVTPLAQQAFAARVEMVRGALFRLHTSESYLNTLNERFPSQLAVDAA
ncbi:iron-containing redox enzyme family protein [Pandoraea sp. SD6-2]|uniref:iron-containing redox enzyme family protein n=1 Tax=Pandoraea sp. SD6-2 TaxID=1286093 RepID=UPI00032EB156|nr:iron-containing redox enzyme family protein [Pandoraea sp. SD6-2]EON12905.1 hypothetical protein C266_14317 [Pandoraea sp. SD6-2]